MKRLSTIIFPVLTGWLILLLVESVPADTYQAGIRLSSIGKTGIVTGQQWLEDRTDDNPPESAQHLFISELNETAYLKIPAEIHVVRDNYLNPLFLDRPPPGFTD